MKPSILATIIFLSIVLIVQLGMHLYVLSKFRPYLQGWFFPMLAFFTVLFPAVSIIERYFNHWLPRVLYYVGTLELGIVFLLLITFALVDLLKWIFQLPLPAWHVFAILGFIFAVTLLGIVQAQKVSVEEKTIPFPEETTILHMTDLHLGAVQQKSFVEKLVKLANSHEYDYVLITGDLYDGSGHVTKDMIKPLTELKAPIYFSMGNHEQYHGEEDVAQVLKSLNITILNDKVIDAGKLQIVGYDHRDNASTLPKLNVTKPALVLFHPPDGLENLKALPAAVQLSGHTHGGQIFPFNWLVRLRYKYVSGLHQIGSNWLYVSNGAGTWGPPMRLGAAPEITLIHLSKDA